MSQKESDKEGPVWVRRPANSSTDIIAVGGGKGGIGKSMLAANLALALGEQAKRVVVLDADLGGANLHTALGMPPPKVTLSDFLEKKKSLEEIIAPTPHAHVFLVSGALDEVGAANPKYAQKLRLMKEIARLDADYVIIDLGAGSAYTTLDFFLIADQGIVSLTPEPTAVENAYRFIKAAFHRRLKNAEHAHGLGKLTARLMEDQSKYKIRTPADLITAVLREDPVRGRDLAADMLSFAFKLVMNQVRTPEDVDMAKNVRTACSKYFGIHIDLLGTLPYDNAVWQSVRKREAVMKAFPQADISTAIRDIAAKFRVSSTTPSVIKPKGVGITPMMEAR